MRLQRNAQRRPIAAFLLKALSFVALLSCVEVITLAPLALFVQTLSAEGPLPYLYWWAGTLAFLLTILLRDSKPNTKADVRQQTPTEKPAALRPVPLRVIRLFFALVAITGGFAGVFVIVLQVMVIPRSLAEAWLEITRVGEAFGFFSFFASEIYALFLLAQAILFIRKRYAMFVTAFLTSLLLCVGMIAGKSGILFLAVLFAFALFLLSQKGQSRLLRLRSSMPPFALACLIALLYAANPDALNPTKSPLPPINVSALLIRIAPSFPLLQDMPGFGFTSDAEKMPSSVYLTSRSLYRVQGESLDVLYLADQKYQRWDGKAWLVDPDTGAEVPLKTLHPSQSRQSGNVRLTLEDDFTSSVPITGDTTSVFITDDAPKNHLSARNRGVRFEPGIKRGFVAELERGTLPPGTEDPKSVNYAFGSSDFKSAQITELARTLGAGTLSDRDYAQSLLDYFSEGFTYSLKTENANGSGNPIETFLFREKKGFCLYFASAFVLLAREAGIPARLCEGYRISLDETGNGVITGNNAHSWPELYLDGNWRTFEPTIAYRHGDPFAWTNEADTETRRQLMALFGGNDETAKQEDLAPSKRFLSALRALVSPVGITLISLVALATLAWKLADRGNRKLRRQARSLVAHYRKRGVEGPEILGWTGWLKSVSAKERDDGQKRVEAERIASGMIILAFAPVRERKSS